MSDREPQQSDLQPARDISNQPCSATDRATLPPEFPEKLTTLRLEAEEFKHVGLKPTENGPDWPSQRESSSFAVQPDAMSRA